MGDESGGVWGRDDIRQLSDPRDLRALTHPLRMQILEALGRSDAPMTATQLGDELGESSASMSYHLRQLAKYGFIEEAPEAGTGRQRPWRRVHRGMSWSTSHAGDPGFEVAARELQHLVMERHLDRIRTYLRHEPLFPPEWRRAAGVSDDRIHVTTDELHAILQAIFDVLQPYERDDPADRPEGSRPVSAMLFALPDADGLTDPPAPGPPVSC